MSMGHFLAGNLSKICTRTLLVAMPLFLVASLFLVVMQALCYLQWRSPNIQSLWIHIHFEKVSRETID